VGSGAKPLPTVRLVQKIVFFGECPCHCERPDSRGHSDPRPLPVHVFVHTHTPTHTHTHTHTQLLAHLGTQPVTLSVVVIMLFRTLLFVINYAARTDTISYTTYPGVTDGVPQGVGQSVTTPNCPRVTVQVFAVYCNMPDPVICSL